MEKLPNLPCVLILRIETTPDKWSSIKREVVFDNEPLTNVAQKYLEKFNDVNPPEWGLTLRETDLGPTLLTKPITLDNKSLTSFSFIQFNVDKLSQIASAFSDEEFQSVNNTLKPHGIMLRRV